MNINAIQKPIQATATFIYETPVTVMASVALGITALALFPKVAPPFLGFAGGVVSTRIFVKIAQRYNHQSLIKLNEWVQKFDARYSYLKHIAMAVSILFSLFIPYLGLVLAAAAGVYRGMLVEIEVNQLKQDYREDKLPGKSPLIVGIF